MKFNIISNLLFYCLLIIHCISCREKRPTIELDNSQQIDETTIKEKIITGDTNSYKLLRLRYYKSNRTIEFTPWAILMSNKYNYSPAHYDVYFSIQSINTEYGGFSKETKKIIRCIDSSTNKLSESYLSKLKDKESNDSIIEFYSGK